MRKEYETLIGIAATAAALELSRFAFSKRTREEIGYRDEWTCQGINGEPCLWSFVHGYPAMQQDGFLITAAHWPNKHQSAEDNNKHNGRCLCIACHSLEEHDRNNIWGAKKLLQMGVYTWKHEKECDEQLYLTLADVLKMRDKYIPSKAAAD